jgi:DEAD/DEAH box helicase domain-containing protein
VAEYCCYDVKTTRLVHEHGVRTGKVSFVSHKTFLKQSVAVDWAKIGPVEHILQPA